MIRILFCPQSQMMKKEVRKSLAADFPSLDDFNYVSFDMGVSPITELVDECSFLPLGYEKKAVVAENCRFLEKKPRGKAKDKLEGLEGLVDYVSNPNPDIDLYLLVPAETLDTTSPVIEAVKKTGKIQEIAIPKDEKWIPILQRYFAKSGSSIDEKACLELVTRLDNDYGRIKSESDKLICHASGEKVTLNDVKALVTPKLEDKAYEISNCLLRGDNKGAIEVYYDLKILNNDEVGLISMLANKFIYMDQVLHLDRRGLSTDQIASALGEKKSGRVYMTLKDLRGIKPSAINRILEELYALQRSILIEGQNQSFVFLRFLANFSLRA